ncbi:pilus assembly protein PilY [Acinetobacter defluvii]|uniref:pilus assembly protein PilY n=1 Tax=Acinetobacter defluvii TaxID=1871111 RepID=UPI003AF58B1A
MKITKKSYGLLKSFSKSILAMSVAATSTALVLSTAVQASDIDIYQQAKSGDITLMFMLDISGSMSDKDDGTTTRIARVKTAMQDLLLGNTSKQIDKLTDDKIIGLSAFSRGGDNRRGYVVVPARRLDCTNGKIGCDGPLGKTQRTLLIEQVNALSEIGGTPTANAYAEVASYLFGTTTRDSLLTASDRRPYIIVESSSTYGVCDAWSGNACISWLRYGGYNPSMIQGLIDAGSSSYVYSGRRYSGTLYIQNGGNGSVGIDYVNDSLAVSSGKYKSPSSLVQTSDMQKCSGQGIYVLTDGAPNGGGLASLLMKKALDSKGTTFSCSESTTGWDCIHKFSQSLLNNNPKGLTFKTAVIGFGNTFNNVASYDRNKSREDNLRALGVIDSDVKNAAKWGILGEGGWYSGNSSKDVVDSVNTFLGDLATDIPAVTTGSPTVPKDPLNSSLYQTDAYFPQFQPTPDKTSQLWAGNLKKYKLNGSGQLVDKSSTKILDTDGKIIDNFDYWSKAIDSAVANSDINTPGSRLFALKGGTWSQLNLRATNNIENRKILTNRVASGSLFVGGTTLRQIKVADLTDSVYKNDPNRGYLMSLLGYSVDAANPTSIDLTKAAELRQIGAVMHSSPILITNKGSVKYDEAQKKMVSSSRDDYVLYGTTQGLIHVVDATTGKEKFSFLPNEMVENQKEAFLKSDATTGGLNKLFYGIDAPWTLYSEYVLASSGGLTVGKGKGNQEGKQLVYGGLRMGGRSYYALNLQDMNNPKLQFHISPADKKVYYNGSSKSYDELKFMAQSWSKPTIAWVKWGDYRKRVMFVGGGYDAGGDDGDARAAGVKGAYAGYESDGYNQTNKKGAGVYMFDADNGDLLWWASANAASSTASTATSGVIALKDDNLKYSVVSEIRPVDSDADGLSDHIYFGDLGGQVFRIDLNNKAQTLGAFSHKSTRLLNLNNGAKSPRFYEMPAFSVYDSGGERFAVISLGSGNRSLPLVNYDATAGYNYDAIYNIYDKDVAKDVYKAGYTYLTHDINSSGLSEISQANRLNDSTIVAPYLTSNGWYYRFQAIPKQQSIKVISTPIVSNHKLFISTFDSTKPGLAGDCGAGVKGESYMNLFCMPFGQCPSTSGGGADTPQQCLEAQGCKVGPGLQDPKPVIIDDNQGGGSSGSGGDCTGSSCKDIPNTNMCISTGKLGIPLANGTASVGNGKKCLIPTRWYEQFR